MSLRPLPGSLNGSFEAVFGGARPRVGTPPFAPPMTQQTGGANVPTTPDTLPAKRGLAGFFDRMLNPTSSLGQFGQALLASGDGPLSGAMAHMIQQRLATGQRDQRFEEWKRQYDYERANPKERAAANLQYFDDNAGNRYSFDPTTGAKSLIFVDPNDKQFIQDGRLVTVPNRVRLGQSAATPEEIAGRPEIGAVVPDFRKKGGPTQPASGPFPSVR